MSNFLDDGIFVMLIFQFSWYLCYVDISIVVVAYWEEVQRSEKTNQRAFRGKWKTFSGDEKEVLSKSSLLI